MEKKEFNTAAIKVIEFKAINIICSSGASDTPVSSDGTIGKGTVGGDGSPRPNSDGYILID